MRTLLKITRLASMKSYLVIIGPDLDEKIYSKVKLSEVAVSSLVKIIRLASESMEYVCIFELLR